MMKAPIVIVGMGELGGVFARGLLKLGHPIVPVVRGMDLEAVAAEVKEPALVLVTVGEDDLEGMLATLPAAFRDRVGLVQNELLPHHWKNAGIEDPTVMVVWFEKKPGIEVRALIPSPVYGPNAALMSAATDVFSLPTTVLDSPEALEFQLVAKNLYILTNNSSGLEVGGTVDTLWSEHRKLADTVAKDVCTLQFALTGNELDVDGLVEVVLAGVRGGASHKTMGRTAAKRLRRALKSADELGLEVAELRRLAKTYLDG